MTPHKLVAPAILLLFASAFAAEPAAPSPGPKAVTVAVAISHIRKEAAEAWKKGSAWPRSQVNFAKDKNWTVPASDVVRALGRQLDSEHPIDAYIKWQLLSFIDQLPADDLDTLNRVTANAPKPLAQPVVREEWLAVSGPGGASLTVAQQQTYVQNLRPVVGNGVIGLQPSVGVVSTGTSVGVEGSTQSYATVIRTANEKLTAERQRVTAGNEMVIRYRDALGERIPQAGGLRLATTIKDLGDRAAAAEPSTGPTVAKLIQATEKLPDDMPPQTRQTLAGWVAETAKIRTQAIESISLNDKGKVVLHGRWVGVADEDAKLLIGRLTPVQKSRSPTDSRP